MGWGERKPDPKKWLLHFGRSLHGKGLRQRPPEWPRRIRLTKGDVCPKDGPKRKENITHSGKSQGGHLTFSKTVRRDEREETSKKKDIKI